MNSRALLTALLFGSAIAGARLVAQAPAPERQEPRRHAAGNDTAQLDVRGAPRRTSPGRP